MIDDISVAFSDLWTNIEARLAKMFSTNKLPLMGLSVAVINDFPQLIPVK